LINHLSFGKKLKMQFVDAQFFKNLVPQNVEVQGKA
jgi:hypothetical protein